MPGTAIWPGCPIPAEPFWLGPDGDADPDGDTLTMRAPARSDWFTDPDGSGVTASAPVLCFELAEDCQVSALVTVDFAASFDAGVLFVHQTDEDYAKLCFERAPDGQNMVVSVVTRVFSDDANGPVIQGNSLHLRVSRYGSVVAFHWSEDARSWHLLRYFRLRNPTVGTRIGFASQSPTGEGCTAVFRSIGYRAGAPADIRDGS